MQRIGVLELVDEDDVDALGQRRAHRGVGPQQVACVHEQVVELEPALSLALRHPFERESRQSRQQPLDQPRPQIVEEEHDGVARFGQRRDRRRPSRRPTAPPFPAMPGLGGRTASSTRTISRSSPASSPSSSSATELLPPLDDLRQPVAVERDSAFCRGSRLVDGGDDGRRVDVGQRRRREVDADEPVPPARAATERDRMWRPVTGRSACPSNRSRSNVGIGEEVVAEPLPPLVEPNPRLHVVVDLERGRKAGVERVLAKDAVREAVQRRDGRGVEALAGDGAPLAFVGRKLRVDRRQFESPPHAVAQFGRGRLGERDGDEVVDLAHRAGGDEPDDAVDQDPRLARAGAGLDEQVAMEIVADASPAVVIDFEKGMLPRERRHASDSSSPTSSASST